MKKRGKGVIAGHDYELEVIAGHDYKLEGRNWGWERKDVGNVQIYTAIHISN